MLADRLKAEIQQGYRDFLRVRELQPRLGQKQMIGAIASTLGSVRVDAEGNRESEPPLCVVEAGTGTGKTVAYLLAVLPIARALGKTVVVATGTVSLQTQLLEKDIPELIAGTGWKYRFALAKGRGRYLCPLRLEQCLDTIQARESGLFLFEDEVPFQPDAASIRLFGKMDDALAAGEWLGDRDAWPESIPDATWRALTIDRRQCTGRKCRKIGECCFFQARDALQDADCIIANHDLIMADLALGGGAILSAPEDTIYVFDEAHRLGDTALRHFAGNCRLQGTINWLEQLAKHATAAQPGYTEAREIAPLLEQVAAAGSACAGQLRESYPLYQAVLDRALPGGGAQYRFPSGDIGEENRRHAAVIGESADELARLLDTLGESLEAGLDNPGFPVPRVDVEQFYQVVGNWSSRAEANAGFWRQLAQKDPVGDPPLARWLTPDEQGTDILLSVSPISAAKLLLEHLWQRCFGAVATSATLRALGSFERFRQQVGLPDSARCEHVAGAFDYGKAAVLSIPDIGADGGDAREHTDALIACLPELIDRSEASLVLFSSRRQMEAVAAAIPPELAARTLVQGELSNGEIVRRHRRRVDDGEHSVIFGLASFAEGLDLPGEYCRHVLIAKLPFAVPDDPLQAAQAEWVESGGGNPFATLMLPDASLRLIQACGRLLRKETDTGRVTLLDRRILTKSYGRQLLDSLPPFRREIQRR